MCETESKHVENDSYVRFDGPSTQNHMLVWKTCPKTVLVLKKRGKALLPHLRDVARHLWFELNLQVVVEPEVGREISGMSDLDFVETYDNEEDAGKLHEFVDFVVCLGGDGVVLHASNLFPGAMPPVISFNLGSLGFLTNHWHGSFSKICGPGLRLGWALASPEVVERFKQNGVLSSGGGLNPLGGAIMAKAMEPREGAEPLMDDLLLRNVCPTLSRKSRALCASIDRHLAPRGVTYARPEGGYFVFLRLPEGVDATELLETARSEFQVGYTPGERCLGPKNTARLSFAFYSEEEMELGVTRLAAALDNYLAG